ELVDTRELEGRDPPDTLVLRRDGTLRFQGSPIDPETYMARHATEPVRIVPDRDALGPRLIEVTAQLRAFGAQSVLLVTRQALE
ncbi:MAG: ExbD/TolR family protein, partial [Ruegeria sp.]